MGSTEGYLIETHVTNIGGYPHPYTDEREVIDFMKSIAVPSCTTETHITIVWKMLIALYNELHLQDNTAFNTIAKAILARAMELGVKPPTA